MDLPQSISNQTDVALRIANRLLLSEEGKKSNLVFSPLSIHVVLSLIAAGSKGPTLDQLVSFLGSKSSEQLNSFASEIVSFVFTDGSPSGGPRLSFANGVWIDKSLSLKPPFRQVVDDFYKATLHQVDFQNEVSATQPQLALSWIDIVVRVLSFF